MSKITAPPIQNAVVEVGKDGKTSGICTLPWVLFFNRVFTGDTGTPWIPTFTNLTVAGAAPTITGAVYKSGAYYDFWIRIIPGSGGSTSATAGSTYCNNFPVILKQDSSNQTVSGLLGGGNGMNDFATNRIYPAGWSAVTVPLTIVGRGLAS